MRHSNPPIHKAPIEEFRIKTHDLPRGFTFASAASGIKKRGGPDVGLIASDRPAAAAAVFTTNRVQAAPVVVSRAHVGRCAGRMRAIVVNSGNANCCTGRAGLTTAQLTCRLAAQALECEEAQVLVASTGVIGVPLPREKLLGALPQLVSSREGTPRAFAGFARAIMTTDTRPKWAAARVQMGGRTARLLGCAKGAGMIHPRMATMLAFVLTDAAISPALLRRAVRAAASRTFNCISIDGDTSTNDMMAVLANGESGVNIQPESGHAARGFEKFVAALEKVCLSLARQIVADGEGAQRVVEIRVEGTCSTAEARKVAETIATSPLVKTALAGSDPNWGRILAAAGRSGVAFNPERVRIWLAGIPVFSRGQPLAFDERRAHRAMLAQEFSIVVNLGAAPHGQSSKPRPAWRVWTCDFSEGYVKVNSSYRT